MGSRQESDSYSSVQESAIIAVLRACLRKAPGAGREERGARGESRVAGVHEVREGWKGGEGCAVCEVQAQAG